MFTLPKLNYNYSDLAPYIDAETMEIHYTKHHQGYTDKLNAALESIKADTEIPIEELLANISKYGMAIRNNAGGFYNHSLFWTIISPKRSTSPRNVLSEAISKHFDSMESFLSSFKAKALAHFGSGWTWLLVNQNKELVLTSTANQDNPLMDMVQEQGTPILGIDLWEHAYYLKHQNDRASYIDAFIELIDWDEVSRRYAVLI